MPLISMFQHAAARRRLSLTPDFLAPGEEVSTRSRPKAAEDMAAQAEVMRVVSTRSRPKAAEEVMEPFGRDVERFNTQPPEGG